MVIFKAVLGMGSLWAFAEKYQGSGIGGCLPYSVFIVATLRGAGDGSWNPVTFHYIKSQTKSTK